MSQRAEGKLSPDRASCAGFPSSAKATPQDSTTNVEAHQPWRTFAVSVFLVCAVWAVFGQTRRFDFVNFDDPIYVYESSAITHGLSLASIKWAFTHRHADNWHPMTTVSHMLDCQLWGLSPGAHHLTNVLVHAVTSVFLFLLLCMMTGSFWRSAFVAAVFAIHPLRVESVAWVAERKDVLSGLFFMLTLWAYVRYVQQVQVSRPKSAVWYGLALGLFALGLMSKPMLVTLPFILLLLDYWPLKRMANDGVRTGDGWRLAAEKMPFLLLAAAICVATLFAQSNSMVSAQHLNFLGRVGNALISYTAYLGQMVFPIGLGVFYPHPGTHLSLSSLGISMTVLTIISAGVLARYRGFPYLIVGWLWYLGMLVPVIGFVQVGLQARADRYTYLPQIGLYIMMTWSVADLCGGWSYRRIVLGSAGTAVLAGLLALARVQTSYWQNSITLWTHTLACTSENYLANYNLGVALGTQAKFDEAIPRYEQALKIRPDYAEAHLNLANALTDQGKSDAAIQHYERALQLKPDSATAHNDLGTALDDQGKFDEAIQHYVRALELKPDYASAHYNWGKALVAQGKLDEAVSHYERALQLKPDYANAQYNLGNALAKQRKFSMAISHFEEALQLNPNYAEAHFNIGTALLNQGMVIQAQPHFQKALNLAAAQNNPALVESMRALLKTVQSTIPRPQP
jgi:tetratricopeptide (TPR) repeat protein